MEDLIVNYNNIITKFTEYTSVKKFEVDLKQKQLEVEEIKAKAALSKSKAKNRRLKLKEYEILNKDTSDDFVRRKGLSPLQKCTAVIRQLAYGVPADHLDEYLRMSESTAIRCLFKFCEYVVEIFGDKYLRGPNADDVQRLLQMHDERHDFPGMLGSLDCMHWKWKNCPVAWKGQFTRGHGPTTIVLEAVASHDLWIWHAFFGVSGSCNDINVLYESTIFNNVLQGNMSEINFTMNDTTYTKGYYLTDGIYPE
ncbi:uncharacterized protein LOC122010925 [Zingiber officinale]|uniref:uncharacterized protein LOC122010925 n=1 Tax=Zingiber officinale TaxID=94328 RepID=UPI001C4D33CB|nr:uncharacterized protein LOC122010925 [Zingiber officinale]